MALLEDDHFLGRSESTGLGFVEVETGGGAFGVPFRGNDAVITVAGVIDYLLVDRF